MELTPEQLEEKLIGIFADYSGESIDVPVGLKKILDLHRSIPSGKTEMAAALLQTFMDLTGGIVDRKSVAITPDEFQSLENFVLANIPSNEHRRLQNDFFIFMKEIQRD